MKKRVKLVVAYDGSRYCGWQIQPNGRTIEGELNRCLSEITKEPITVIGASRTDAGVHALGNVAVFDTEARMPGEKYVFALNTRLPEDIKIQSSKEVPLEFHPRYQNTIKTYEYRILNRTHPNPIGRDYALFYYFPLDLEKMKQGAAYLIGEHDFKSFSSIHAEVKSTVRNIYDIKLKQDGDMITISITGNGFLYNMVRIIVGTLLEVGSGKLVPRQMGEILDAKDRSRAGNTAPARGLMLKEIQYPE